MQRSRIFAKPGIASASISAFAFMSESGDTLSEDYVVFGGDEQEMNTLVAKYISKTHPQQKDYLKRKAEITAHERYKALVKAYKDEQSQLLQDFIDEEKATHTQFIRWAAAEIQFDYCNTLLLPLDFHPKTPLFPLEWYDFIYDVPMGRLDVALNS
ncbi:MAG: hypothetical protein IPN76_27840 [Saprospiraceae bacterium]|nr:hypothetical protein [Saprospiraceae bacterium]